MIISLFCLQPTVSQPKPGQGDSPFQFNLNQTNTPRILELDINRMLIGQNQVA